MSDPSQQGDDSLPVDIPAPSASSAYAFPAVDTSYYGEGGEAYNYGEYYGEEGYYTTDGYYDPYSYYSQEQPQAESYSEQPQEESYEDYSQKSVPAPVMAPAVQQEPVAFASASVVASAAPTTYASKPTPTVISSEPISAPSTSSLKPMQVAVSTDGAVELPEGYIPSESTVHVMKIPKFAPQNRAAKFKTEYYTQQQPHYTVDGNKKFMKKTTLRTAGGEVWEDPTLLRDWQVTLFILIHRDPNDFRLFCGDLGNEVTEDMLSRAFSHYSSFQKAKVVRDKKNNKPKGFGFVSFADPNDFVLALKEMNGKYVGNRPIKLRKSNWEDRNVDLKLLKKIQGGPSFKKKK